MNHLKATVSKIQAQGAINIVTFDFFTQKLSMMSLNFEQNVKLGTVVYLSIKPTHIALARNLSSDISFSNQLSATIESIENGELLSSIRLKIFDSYIESVITRNSSQRMQLKAGESVVALIKASELSIGEIIDA